MTAVGGGGISLSSPGLACPNFQPALPTHRYGTGTGTGTRTRMVDVLGWGIKLKIPAQARDRSRPGRKQAKQLPSRQPPALAV